MHRDDYDNTLLHLYGRKSVVLIDPSTAEAHTDVLRSLFTTPGSHATLYGVQSSELPVGDVVGQAQPTTPDSDPGPTALDVPRLHCSLEPGELLYIPKGWLHDVETQGGPTVSVALRFQAGAAMSPDMIWESAIDM